MGIKLKYKNFATVSLIEIMMIFFIIGIVAVASFGLSKPKAEYMRKIAVYSAYEQLQNAAMQIVSEGHIDFSSDINSCVARDIDNICVDDEGKKYPGMGSQLPKSVARAAIDSSGNPADSHISTTSYSAVNAQTFLHLQDGFCQRLAAVYKLNTLDINCATTESDNTHGTLIDDISNNVHLYPITFSSYTPSLYLPNGQVYYFGKNLYYRSNDKTRIINKETNLGALTLAGVVLGLAISQAESGSITQEQLDEAIEAFEEAFTSIPNDSRLAIRKIISNETNSSQYYVDLWKQSKDYFNVYIDINGKMANANDIKNGPDMLNYDVFLFRVYTDGAVRPDYESGFPIDLLKAKILYKQPGETKYTSPATWSGKYASVPLVYAQCYANTAGTYSAYTISTFGSYVDYSNLCPRTDLQPIPECIGLNGETNCKVFINRPSFFVK